MVLNWSDRLTNLNFTVCFRVFFTCRRVKKNPNPLGVKCVNQVLSFFFILVIGTNFEADSFFGNQMESSKESLCGVNLKICKNKN